VDFGLRIAGRRGRPRGLRRPGAPIQNPKSKTQNGFTLIEMLTVAASLIIVLGLMTSLARYIRGRSAGTATKRMLVQLDGLIREHHRATGELPMVPPLIADAASSLDEETLQKAAAANSRALAASLSRQLERSDAGIAPRADATLRDAWGTPIVYMAPGAPNILTSPQSRFFLISAGPDRSFLTRVDNLYSYEEAAGQRE
jgi:type II secretory pathway pseudopilin PulG